MVAAHAVEEGALGEKRGARFFRNHLLEVLDFLHQAAFVRLERADEFLVLGTVQEGKSERPRVVVETGQMLEDLLAEDFPALVRDVENHAFGPVAVAFGVADNAAVLFQRDQAVVDGRRANFRPAVQFTDADFGYDIVPTPFMFQNEPQKDKVVSIHK